MLIASLILPEFNPEVSWLPDPGQFINMIVFMFWWILAFMIAAIPIVIVLFIAGLILSLFSG